MSVAERVRRRYLAPAGEETKRIPEHFLGWVVDLVGDDPDDPEDGLVYIDRAELAYDTPRGRVVGHAQALARSGRRGRMRHVATEPPPADPRRATTESEPSETT